MPLALFDSGDDQRGHLHAHQIDLPGQPKARVEMTPIMDVVFLLLVFFIYAFMTMTVQRGMKVELPKADGVVSKQQNIRIVLTAENQLLLDGRTAMSLDAAADSVALRYESPLTMLELVGYARSMGI